MTDAPAPIRVLLVDDHAVVRAGLRALLESQSDLTIVGEAADPASAIDGANKTKPDVVLMDLNLGQGESGADATAQLMELPEPPQDRLQPVGRSGSHYLRIKLLGKATSTFRPGMRWTATSSDNGAVISGGHIYRGGCRANGSHA